MVTERHLRTMMASRGADWRPSEDASDRLHRAIAARRRARVGGAAATGTVGAAAVIGVALALGSTPAVAPAGPGAPGGPRPAPRGYHLAATETGKLPDARLTLTFTPTGQPVLLDNSCDIEPKMQMQVFVDGASSPALILGCGPAASSAASATAPFNGLPLDPAKVSGRPVTLTATFRPYPPSTDGPKVIASGPPMRPRTYTGQARLSVYVADGAPPSVPGVVGRSEHHD